MAPESSVKKTKDCPVYMIGGAEHFLVQKETDTLLDKLLDAEERQTSLWQPDLQNLPEISEILDELRTLPFLAGKRVVLIKDAENFITKNREYLEKYVEAPSSCGVLILQVDKIDKRTKFTKKVKELGGLLEISDMKGKQLSTYASEYCKSEHKKTIDFTAVQLLIQLVGDGPGQICSEIDKLVLFIGDRKTILPEDVQTLVGKNRMFDAFEVINALTQGSVDSALQRLRNMFASDKSAEFKVVGAFSYQFRQIFGTAAYLQQGLNPQEAARRLRIPPFVQKQVFAQARLLKAEQWGRILAHFGDIDYRIKTGRTTASSALERFVIQLAAVFQPVGRF